MFWIFLTNIKNMFFDETRIKNVFCYISFCPLRFLYNREFILMATSLGTNAVIVTRADCTGIASSYTRFFLWGFFVGFFLFVCLFVFLLLFFFVLFFFFFFFGGGGGGVCCCFCVCVFFFVFFFFFAFVQKYIYSGTHFGTYVAHLTGIALSRRFQWLTTAYYVVFTYFFVCVEKQDIYLYVYNLT